MKRLRLKVFINRYGEITVYARKTEEKIARLLYPTSRIIIIKFLLRKCMSKVKMNYIKKYRLKLNNLKKLIKISHITGIEVSQPIINKNIKIKKYRNKRRGIYEKI